MRLNYFNWTMCAIAKNYSPKVNEKIQNLPENYFGSFILELWKENILKLPGHAKPIKINRILSIPLLLVPHTIAAISTKLCGRKFNTSFQEIPRFRFDIK